MKKLRDIVVNLTLVPYQVFTLLCAAFILGISIAPYLSFDWSSSAPVFLIIVCLLLLSALINLLMRTKFYVVLSWGLLIFITGLICYSFNSATFCEMTPLEENILVKGIIVSNPVKDFQRQQVILETEYGNCKDMRILVNLPHFPDYRYGQAISLQGKLQKPGMIDDFDYQKYLRPKRVGYLLLNPQQISPMGDSGPVKYRIISILYSVKNRFERSVVQVLPEPEASLGVGIITGAKANIDEGLQNDLNAAGLTHIIALSGFNITIIISALALLLSGRFNRKYVFIAGALLTITFIVMTGASASVVRAGIFSLLILYSRTIGRKAHQTNLLLLTAAVMLAFNPFLLKDDLGFQLSFLAFAGLIYIANPLTHFFNRSRLKSLHDYIKLPLIETLSAQIAVFPLIAFAFGRISLISPLSNIMVLWLIPFAMLLVFLCGISGMIFIPLGKLVGLLSWPALAYIIEVARLSSRLPLASINTPKYNFAFVSSLYLVVIIVLLLALKSMRTLEERKADA